MDINERVARLEADEKNIFHQLTEIKEEVKDIRRLTNAVEKIATKTESIDSKVDYMGERIYVLENKPVADFVHYKRLIIGAVATALVSGVAVALLSLILKN